MILLSFLLAASATDASSAPICLRRVAKTRTVTPSSYDVSNDRRGDSSISCNFNLTASEAAADLRAIVDAADRKGCGSLVSVAAIPLSVQFRRGRTTQLSKKSICRQQTRIRQFIKSNRKAFSIDQLDLLGYRGAFVGSGKILVNTVRDGSGRPHLKLVAIGPV